MFGSTVVVKWNTNTHMTILTGQDVSYLVLQAGRLDSVFFFEGYWRSQNSRRSGLARFEIRKDAGGRRLMGDSLASDQLIFDGTVSEGNNRPSIPVVFRYQWAIRREILAKKFWVVAHRGGGRMSELLPHSENTVELLRIAEWYGVNGVEIDVRLTKDGVPILYHDNTLNPRLVRKTPMIGPVEEYTFPQLRTFVRLLNGEQIPTLDEALRTIVYETNLTFVWLDSKTEERDLVERMVPLLQQYTAEAEALAGQGLRDSLEIMIGVPTDKVYEEILRYPSFSLIPTITEKSLDRARTLNSPVWAPLWSGGINVADNATARSEGRRIVVWTLDDPQFVQEYVNSSQYDGILSDYPMIVAYYHYVR
ncbi:MAG: glycerophosphodiester phosphodiesterase [Ignavibacteriales bacterium]|nr:glycerophosphodiester phosphodiesterase [Ignavibacteriales bacterium]